MDKFDRTIRVLIFNFCIMTDVQYGLNMIGSISYRAYKVFVVSIGN